MKSLIVGLMLTAGSVSAQTFFVEKTDKWFESKIADRIKYEGFALAESKESSDYVVTCYIRQTSKINSMYKGYVQITDKSGKEVAKTEEVRRGAVAVNGFNAGANIFGVIAEKKLPEILNQLKQTK